MSRNVLVRTAVAAIGVSVLVLGAIPATGAFRSALEPEVVGTWPDALDPAGRRELDRIHHAQFECIRDDLVAQVPTGTPVFVPLNPATPENPTMWQQRLTELAYPVGPIVDAPGPGVTTLTLAGDEVGDGCTGVVLVVDPS